MFEELFDATERQISTIHERIKAAVIPPTENEFMLKQIAQIQTMILQRNEPDLLKKFNELVPGYRCCCGGLSYAEKSDSHAKKLVS